ncbi:MAG: 50S ribosomal protein L19e [Candidatus Pacearchaeota archaeon]|jgi:large subunit ribosomal protein L19e
MDLSKKKNLAARTLNVGKERIVFINARLDEIKEAITKQDIRDLTKDGAIIIKNVKGRKRIIKKKKKRSTGKIRKKVNTRKRDYIIITRKLRNYLKELRTQGKLSKEEIKELRKKIRNKEFKSKAHLKQILKLNK